MKINLHFLPVFNKKIVYIGMKDKDDFMSEAAGDAADIIVGVLEKDAEPILNEEKELGCLLTVKSRSETCRVEIFSSVFPVLYKKALKGVRVVVPVRKSGAKFLANVAYSV